jgi:hypothetical protein
VMGVVVSCMWCLQAGGSLIVLFPTYFVNFNRIES